MAIHLNCIQIGFILFSTLCMLSPEKEQCDQEFTDTNMISSERS